MNSQSRPPSQPGTGRGPAPGAGGQNKPPSWEQFSAIEATKQQQIYSTMCDQISQQQKAMQNMYEGLRNDQQALQRFQQLASKSKLEDENRKLKLEVDALRNKAGPDAIMQSQHSQSGNIAPPPPAANNEKQIQAVIMKFMQEKENLMIKVKAEKEQYEEQIQTLDIQNRELMERISQLDHMQRQQPVMDVNSSAQRIALLEKECSEQRATIGELRTAVNDLKHRNDQHQHQFNQAKSELDQAMAQINEYRRQVDNLAQFEFKYRQVSSTIEQLQDEIVKHRRIAERLESDIDREQKEKHNLGVQLAGYQERFSKLKEMETLETQFQDIYVDFQSIKSQYGMQNQKLRDYETVMEELVAENSRLVLEICNQKL